MTAASGLAVEHPARPTLDWAALLKEAVLTVAIVRLYLRVSPMRLPQREGGVGDGPG